MSAPARSRQGHGTRACYIAGCDLPECRAENTRYMRAWRAQTPGYMLNRRIVDRPAHMQDRRRAPNGTRER